MDMFTEKMETKEPCTRFDMNIIEVLWTSGCPCSIFPSENKHTFKLQLEAIFFPVCAVVYVSIKPSEGQNVAYEQFRKLNLSNEDIHAVG